MPQIFEQGRAGRADIREGQHTLGVCQTGIRFCRVFDDRQRAVAAPSCNGRRVSDRVISPRRRVPVVLVQRVFTPPGRIGEGPGKGNSNTLLQIAIRRAGHSLARATRTGVCPRSVATASVVAEGAVTEVPAQQEAMAMEAPVVGAKNVKVGVNTRGTMLRGFSSAKLVNLRRQDTNSLANNMVKLQAQQSRKSMLEAKLQERKPWYILRPDGVAASSRDVLALIALYFILPYEIAFVDTPTFPTPRGFLYIFNRVIDLFFLIEMVMEFFIAIPKLTTDDLLAARSNEDRLCDRQPGVPRSVVSRQLPQGRDPPHPTVTSSSRGPRSCLALRGLIRAVNFDVRWFGRLVALAGPPSKRLGIFVTATYKHVAKTRLSAGRARRPTRTRSAQIDRHNVTPIQNRHT